MPKQSKVPQLGGVDLIPFGAAWKGMNSRRSVIDALAYGDCGESHGKAATLAVLEAGDYVLLRST